MPEKAFPDAHSRDPLVSPLLNKVPEVTLHLGTVTTSYVMGGLFLVALVIQLRLKKYLPPVYRIVVVLVSVVGTLISDNLVDGLGISLKTTSVLFASALAVVFVAWWGSERTLSVHSIHTTKRELFYWAAILFTFALGTSAGDLAAEASGLGYALSALMFAALIALTALAYYGLKINGVLAFWMVYILTRPLGASMGDLLSQPTKDGGLGLGTSVTSVVFLLTILGLVTFLTLSKADAISPDRTVA